ncbi:MAG: hypothetical protein Q9216_001376, partial [Gyalolechia sp. 2 TL-2023]
VVKLVPEVDIGYETDTFVDVCSNDDATHDTDDEADGDAKGDDNAEVVAGDDAITDAVDDATTDADVDTKAGGSDEGGRAHPADPHAQYDDVLANVDEYVVAGQFDKSPEHDVVTKVEVTNAVDVRRVLLCRGVKMGKLLVGALLGMLLNVADDGAMGPYSRAELRMVLLGAGSRVLWLSISSSTFAQL